MELHPTRDTVFLQVFWSFNFAPKFELTVRSISEKSSKYCDQPSCSICHKVVSRSQVFAAPTIPSIVGPLIALQIQRFSGNAFMPASVTWKSQPIVMIQWGNTQVDHSFLVTRRCQLMTAHSNIQVVVKTLKPEVAVACSLESKEQLLVFYRSCVLIQAAANILAQEWNRRITPGDKISSVSFVELAVCWLDKRKEYGLIEHSINGRFQKYSNHLGTSLLNEESNLAAAFSHFSWSVTKGRILVCNIQGSDSQFTHPVLHTMGEGYAQFANPQNRGRTGISSFFEQHKCNEICSKLKLPQFSSWGK